MMNNLQSSAFVAKTTQLLSSVAHLRLLLVMFLTLTVSAEVWGADITFTGDDIRSSFSFGTSYGEATFSSDGFSIYSSSGYGNTSGQFRVAKNAELTISSSVGNITKVVIVVTSTSYKLNDTNNKISWDETTGTYTASGSGSESVTFNNSSTSIARIKSIQIFYSSSTTYTVTYDLNGGTGTTPTQANVAAGGTFTLAASSEFSKTGYSFAGWNDGTTTYDEGDTYTMPAEAVTLKAQWTPLTQYTVTWMVDKETLSTEDVYEDGKVSSVPTVTELPCGDKFVGWTTDPITTPQDNAPTVFTTVDGSPVITKATTFYAVFADYVNE